MYENASVLKELLRSNLESPTRVHFLETKLCTRRPTVVSRNFVTTQNINVFYETKITSDSEKYKFKAKFKKRYAVTMVSNTEFDSDFGWASLKVSDELSFAVSSE